MRLRWLVEIYSTTAKSEMQITIAKPFVISATANTGIIVKTAPGTVDFISDSPKTGASIAAASQLPFHIRVEIAKSAVLNPQFQEKNLGL